jgi:hypothetical protein
LGIFAVFPFVPFHVGFIEKNAACLQVPQAFHNWDELFHFTIRFDTILITSRYPPRFILIDGGW